MFFNLLNEHIIDTDVQIVRKIESALQNYSFICGVENHLIDKSDYLYVINDGIDTRSGKFITHIGMQIGFMYAEPIICLLIRQ